MPAILSVGIDIGTSTTQVIFSRITLDNTAGYFSAPRIAIVDKEIIYKSGIFFTPLQTQTLLNGDAVRDIVASEFQKAGYRPENVDTGAVIITGESARKENAELVLRKLSEFAGEFVVSTAGPDLESIIAGKGSGAFQYSIENECSVVNIDIGGGTSNIVTFDNGETVGKGCLDIGGRLIRVDSDWTVTYISTSAQKIVDYLGVSVAVGRKTDQETLSRITDEMASLLAQSVGLAPRTVLLEQMQTSKSTPLIDLRAKYVCFSGGVADCYYHDKEKNTLAYGDIGILLAQSLRRCGAFAPSLVIDAGETIRATVVGAGTYTTSLSGSTIFYSPGIFPVKNVPALKLGEQEQSTCLVKESKVLYDRCKWFLEQSDSPHMVLSLPGLNDPTYEEVKLLAKNIVEAMNRALPAQEPIIVVTETDIAKALGIAMRSFIGDQRKVAAIDSIKIDVGDFVDIGKPLMDGLVVPVIVKTLLFG